MSYATKEQLEELASYMARQINVPTIGIGGGYAPIGTIISYMGTTAPQDYLACDGDTHNIADYPQLADFFEAQFGSKNYFGGDGTTTFAVPDLQGEFLRGTGTNSHTNQGSGANVGVHQDGTIHSNVYMIENQTAGWAAQRNQGNAENADSVIGDVLQKINGANNTAQDTIGTFTSRPTNTSILWCIKAVNAGDVYSTTERVVGTWIDGKPIYQKTFTGTLSNSTTDVMITLLENVDMIVNANGCASKTGDKLFIPSEPYGVRSNGVWFEIFVNGTNLIFVYQQSWSYTNYIITVQYTKTTD